MRFHKRTLVAATLSLVALAASAALGDVQRDLREPRASVTPLQQVLPSGTRVVQYVDRQRTVFAVTWSGPFMPELRSLLGTHYPALVDAQARGSLHAPVVVRTQQVAIFSGGTVGAFSGRAWLPARVPTGIDAKELP